MLSKHGRRAQTSTQHRPTPPPLRPRFARVFGLVGSGAKANNRTEKQQNTRAPTPRKPTQANNLERFAIYTITATKCSARLPRAPS